MDAKASRMIGSRIVLLIVPRCFLQPVKYGRKLRLTLANYFIQNILQAAPYMFKPPGKVWPIYYCSVQQQSINSCFPLHTLLYCPINSGLMGLQKGKQRRSQSRVFLNCNLLRLSAEKHSVQSTNKPSETGNIYNRKWDFLCTEMRVLLPFLIRIKTTAVLSIK